MRVALFDVDGTLIQGQSYAYLLRWLWRRGWRRRRVLGVLCAGLPSQLLRKAGLVDRLRNQERWARGMAWLLRDVPVAEAEELFRLFCRDLGAALRPEVAQELQARRAEGYRIVLASTSIAPVVERLAQALGAHGFVATPLHICDGRFTGRLAGPPCNGHEKLRYLDALAESWGEAVDWGASCAYSDGMPDLPMLERVGSPVVVDPDPRLLQVATDRRWRVVP